MINIVELIANADDDCGFNQSCAYGHLIKDHAVYCHNTEWKEAPRKCRNTWYTGGVDKDEDCPGFKPNLNKEAKDA